jgi:hypothetical protein
MKPFTPTKWLWSLMVTSVAAVTLLQLEAETPNREASMRFIYQNLSSLQEWRNPSSFRGYIVLTNKHLNGKLPGYCLLTV